MKIFSGLFFFCILLFFISCTKKKSPVPIPFDAEIVARINTQEIITQIAKEKLFDFSISDLFSSSKEDTTQKQKGIETLLENPSDAGIDLMEDAWAFYRNSETVIIAQLDDFEELEDAITEHITDKIIHSENMSAFTGKNISAVWNKEYALFLISERPVSEKHLFSLLAKERKLFNPTISEDHSEKEVLLWTNNFYLKSFLPSHLQNIITRDSFSLTSIDFQSGKTLLENKDLLTNEAGILKSVNFNPRFFNGTYLISLGLTVNLSNLPIHNKEFSPAFLNQCFDGNLYLRADSIKSITKIFKTIELDEEFNSIEKTDSIVNYYPSYITLLPVNNKDSTQALLNALEKKGALTKEKDYFKLILSEYPVYLYFQQDALTISNKPGKGLPEKESFLNASQNSQKEYMLLKVTNSSALQNTTYKNYLPEQVKNLTLSALPDSNNTVKLQGEIETSQKEEYSLLTLIDLFKSQAAFLLKEENSDVIQ